VDGIDTCNNTTSSPQSLRFPPSASVTLSSSTHRSSHSSNCSSNLDASSTACSLPRYQKHFGHISPAKHKRSPLPRAVTPHRLSCRHDTHDSNAHRIPFHHPSLPLALLFCTRTLLHFPVHACDIIHYSTARSRHAATSLYRANHPPSHLILPRHDCLSDCPPVALPIKEAHTPARTSPPIDVPSPPALHRIALHCIAPLHLHQHHRQRCNCLAAPRFFAARYLRLVITCRPHRSFLIFDHAAKR